MKKIIVLEFISLDGVIQAPGGPEEDTSGGRRFAQAALSESATPSSHCWSMRLPISMNSACTLIWACRSFEVSAIAASMRSSICRTREGVPPIRVSPSRCNSFVLAHFVVPLRVCLASAGTGESVPPLR